MHNVYHHSTQGIGIICHVLSVFYFLCGEKTVLCEVSCFERKKILSFIMLWIHNSSFPLNKYITGLVKSLKETTQNQTHNTHTQTKTSILGHKATKPVISCMFTKCLDLGRSYILPLPESNSKSWWQSSHLLTAHNCWGGPAGEFIFVGLHKQGIEQLKSNFKSLLSGYIALCNCSWRIYLKGNNVQWQQKSPGE